MKIFYGIIELIARHHFEQGNRVRYHLAIIRMQHIRAIKMYGYDHLIAARYRALMHQRLTESLDQKGN